MAGEVNDPVHLPGAGGDSLPVFRGVTQLALDAKGRLAVPAKHRDALAMNGPGRLVLTADPSRCPDEASQACARIIFSRLSRNSSAFT